MSPLTDTKLKKTSKKSITSSGCWLCTLSHVHSAAAILVRKLKTTTNIQCGHCYSKSYHQTWLGHCDISSVSIAMLLSWQRWLGNHQAGLSAVWKLLTVITDNLQQILQLFFIIWPLVTEVLNDSNSSLFYRSWQPVLSQCWGIDYMSHCHSTRIFCEQCHRQLKKTKYCLQVCSAELIKSFLVTESWWAYVWTLRRMIRCRLVHGCHHQIFGFSWNLRVKKCHSY